MLQRTLKNSSARFWLAALFMVALSCAAPEPSYAYDFTTPDLGIGGDEICPGTGLTRRIMPCIKETILSATNDFLIPFSQYAANTVSLCCVLAVTLLGALMISGKNTAPVRDTLVLGVKLGAVVFFTSNFGGLYPLILDSMDEMVGVVTGYALHSDMFAYSSDCVVRDETTAALQIWDDIDCAIDFLVGGVYSDAELKKGIIGFLVSCLISNPIGYAIGMVGILIIVKLLSAVFKALCILISAYVGLSLMVIISPFVIPLILFRATKTYFQKWVRITGSFIIQPIFLFAYLAILLAAFETVIFTGKYSFFHALAGDVVQDPDFESNYDGIGGWLKDIGGAYAQTMFKGQAINIDPKHLSTGQQPGNPTNSGAFGGVTSAQVPLRNAVLGLSYNALQKSQQTTMDALGIGRGGTPKFFEVGVPINVVDWETLAAENNYQTTDSSGNTVPDAVGYMIDVLMSAFMAWVMAYIFLELLRVLPFIGSGIAMGSGMVDEKSLGMSGLGLGRNGPPGVDFMKNLKLNMNEGHERK